MPRANGRSTWDCGKVDAKDDPRTLSLSSIWLNQGNVETSFELSVSLQSVRATDFSKYFQPEATYYMYLNAVELSQFAILSTKGAPLHKYMQFTKRSNSTASDHFPCMSAIRTDQGHKCRT